MNVVLDEIDFNYFLLFSDIDGEIEKTKQMIKFSPDTLRGKWAKENGVRYKQTTMNNHLQSICKYVVYADLSEHQQTDYLLRF
jgi:hypothetical protein